MIANLLLYFLVFYALFIAALTVTALLPDRKISHGKQQPENISIVIPCKNEATNIPSLIAALERQEYPAATEVIFIDDGSTDTTAYIIEEVGKKSSIPVRLLPGRYTQKRCLTSKQQAIDLGIREASYKVIALTDADMQPKTGWLASLAGCLHDDTALVFGHTVISPANSAFSLFQSFQLEFLFAVAWSFHKCRIAGSCMGNNLLLRKEAYIKSGGHDATGYSITEDQALLRHFNRMHLKTASTTPFYPSASTYPHHDIRPFIRQMHRWGRGGFKTGVNLLPIGVLLIIQNIAFIAECIALPLTEVNHIAGINFLLTWFFVAAVFRKNRSPVSSLFFPVYYLLLIIETALLSPLILLRRTVTWKERPV